MKHIANISLLFLLSVGCAALDLRAMEKGAFEPPSLEGYAREQEWENDGNHDGIKETHFVRYLDRTGNKIVQLSAGERTYAWIVKSYNYPNNASDLTYNYVIIDTDCDGKYDQKIDSYTHFYLPDCLKEKMRK